MSQKKDYKSIESYKHKAAKEVLVSWFADDFEVSTEMKFESDGWVFYPDVTLLKDGHIQAFYEIVHKHPLDAKKLSRMMHYCWINKLDIFCHEVDAEWILLQVEKPENIVKFSFDLSGEVR